jgi:hypothetical protein
MQFALKPCDGGRSQNFVLNTNGNLRAEAGMCLAIYNFEGPGVVAWSCNEGENEEFVFDASSTSICSKGGAGKAARCLNVKSTSPKPGPAPTELPLQLWAKPQPNGAVAVLVLNNGATGSANVTATFTFDEVRFKSKDAKVTDVWGIAEPRKVTGSSFTTDAFGPHDSRFYLITPA